MARLNSIELQRALAAVSYPATWDDLVNAARNNGASDDVTSVLGDLGDDHFNRPADVTQAISFSAKANR